MRITPYLRTMYLQRVYSHAKLSSVLAFVNLLNACYIINTYQEVLIILKR